MKKEQEKGGKLMSSIESLDFSVTCEEDVKIVVKDIDGWKLGSSFPMVLYRQFLFPINNNICTDNFFCLYGNNSIMFSMKLVTVIADI